MHTRIWLVRWPDGHTALISARNKRGLAYHVGKMHHEEDNDPDVRLDQVIFTDYLENGGRIVVEFDEPPGGPKAGEMVDANFGALDLGRLRASRWSDEGGTKSPHMGLDQDLTAHDIIGMAFPSFQEAVSVVEGYLLSEGSKRPRPVNWTDEALTNIASHDPSFLEMAEALFKEKPPETMTAEDLKALAGPQIPMPSEAIAFMEKVIRKDTDTVPKGWERVIDYLKEEEVVEFTSREF